MTDNELNEKFAELAVAQAKTEATLERMGIHLGGITNNNGSTTEEYFYNSMLEHPILGGVRYDRIR